MLAFDGVKYTDQMVLGVPVVGDVTIPDLLT